MPILRNTRHERFAQSVAAGASLIDAYRAAGYRVQTASASRLARKVAGRIEELKAEAARAALEKLDISEARVLREYARIAFADLRRAMEWFGELTTQEEHSADGGTLQVKHTISNHVRLISAAELDDDTAAAIAEVRYSNAGGLSLKLHSKLAALDALADYLAIAKRPRPRHADDDGLPEAPAEMSPRETARRIAFALARAAHDQPPADQEPP